MQTKISIVLADDHVLFRDALGSMLERDPLVTIAGKVSNGKELLNFLKKNKTDLVLLDPEMPVMSGMEALKVINERYKQVKVIVLGENSNIIYMNEAIRLGARSYLSKNCSVEELQSCIVKVYETGFFLEEEKANEILKFSTSYKSPELYPGLSEREIEILKELCTGKREKDIADKLSISHNTVHKHRERIYRKTNSHNLADIIFYALRKGILSPI
jgi:DNA-binding NarL/FixJ family response regulator